MPYNKRILEGEGEPVRPEPTDLVQSVSHARRDYLREHGMRPQTSRTVRDPDAPDAELRSAKATFVEDGQDCPSVSCAATPVALPEGRASVALSASSERLARTRPAREGAVA